MTEFAVVCVIAIPLLLVFMYAGWEICQYFTIKSALDSIARSSARALVLNYNSTKSEAGQSFAFGVNSNMGNFVNNANQFTVSWDAATPPTYVQVSCTYPCDGSGGLNPFPNPDVFGLAHTMNTISSNFTMPVQ